MIAVKEGKDVYLAEHAAFAERSSGDAAPLRRLRRTAIERFAALGFPAPKDEEWRFTNLAPLTRIPFEPGDADDLRLSAPRLPKGVLVCPLAEALARRPDLVEPHLARLADFHEHAFTALNAAFLRDGAFVYLPAGAVVEEPITIAFRTGAADRPLMWPRRSLIVAGTGSQARIIERYDGAEGVSFTNAVTEVVIAENAVLDYYHVQKEGRRAFHLATVQVSQHRDSAFTSHAVALGGALARTDLNVVLDGEGCSCTLNGLSLAGGNQLIDNHTHIDHARPHCNSRELYKGILDGQARGVFRGRIRVRLDAQKTDARQTNKTLLLSDDAVIDSQPQLEIHADDVKCTHGASIGQLDEEQLFYLRTRGLGREEARRILTYAFANEVLDRIRIGPLRAELEQSLFAFSGRPDGQPVKEAS
jgi:Fe-S cluster assembly protein SufD